MTVINTNVGALNARYHSARADFFVNKALERLSSGKRINSAADDAAGLEKVIHSSLSFKGKRLNEARGEEWFLTNTEEIANVVNIILETNI